MIVHYAQARSVHQATLPLLTSSYARCQKLKATYKCNAAYTLLWSLELR
jgi:hypothetical protein